MSKKAANVSPVCSVQVERDRVVRLGHVATSGFRCANEGDHQGGGPVWRALIKIGAILSTSNGARLRQNTMPAASWMPRREFEANRTTASPQTRSSIRGTSAASIRPSIVGAVRPHEADRYCRPDHLPYFETETRSQSE